MTANHTITCTECHAENRSDRLICAKCGAYLGTRGDDLRTAEHLRANGRSGPVAMPPYGRRQKPRRLLGVLLLLLLFVAVGSTALLVYRQYKDLQASRNTVTLPATTSTTTPATTTAPSGGSTTTNATSADQSRVFPSVAKASSSLPPGDEFTYGPSNLSDNDLATAWNEAASGSGVGEWVSFTFDQPIGLARIDVANGYQRDQKRFLGNGRIQAMRIEYSTGATQEVQLFDEMGYQQIEPAVSPEDEVTSVRITILSVYAGESWEDAALSEVRFVGTR